MIKEFSTPESQEARIERLIDGLAAREGMDSDDILSDIVSYAPHPANTDANPPYLQSLAEKLGISLDEVNQYALNIFEEWQRFKNNPRTMMP